ncbi:hypothetical protein GIB67_015505 [Kingdonia uniflora]|uniref:Endonuclease/exonuclease/phosphatase domain-containing protein n=1 Tax=Kingdonia uniflora TaxID=39325 RepID=A0A7J7LAG5_9MAGN|nr:hypothetical protein GIB67_015505 [Kingdonia uniflora]
MRVIYWNTRGLKDRKTLDYLRKNVVALKPMIICLVEPKIYNINFILTGFSKHVITNKEAGLK